MFVLARLQDNIRILPIDFKKPKEEAIADEVNKKYSNKVVNGVGLCIRLFDIVEVGEPLVLPNDGSTYSKVVFRMVVFRPFVGEVMVGKIRSCSKQGVFVSLGFFDDILIPPDNLQDGSYFDEEEQIWVWQLPESKLFMDIEEEIRFKLAKEVFVETMPVVREKNGQDGAQVNTSSRQSPYSLIAAINQDGLGLLSWWAS